MPFITWHEPVVVHMSTLHDMPSHMFVCLLEDMQRFVEEFPELKQMSIQVSKHVALSAEISRKGEDGDGMGWDVMLM